MLFLPANNKNFYCLAAAISTVIFFSCSSAYGQIVPDTTLPDNSVILPDGNTSQITGGTTVGSNLFHSFREFSLSTGSTAWFNNAIDIQNIIGRVTGDSISTIDGLIRANGNANLFLIDPKGIIFGENAALDIGGSFVATTAESIQFANEAEFSAVNPDAPPLLTINMPIGLQFGGDNGDIIVRGNGHNTGFDFGTYTVDRFDRNTGLSVATGNTIGLIAQNVSLEGGNLTAEAGNIELGGVKSGSVELTANDLGWTFDYDKLNRGDINLLNSASIDVSGSGSGSIQIYGKEINLTDGSAIFAETEGDAAGGLIAIDANDVSIIGTDPDLFLPSSIWSDVYLDATGDGGSVAIKTNNLLLDSGGSINVNTFSLGNAGNLTVDANDIKVIGESDGGDFISGLFAQADIFFTGRGGGIFVKTASLQVSDGAQIATTSFGEGDAGDLTIDAENIQLIGTSKFGASGLFVSTEAKGNGGDLILQTNSLAIADGAKIVVSTRGSGNAGILKVSAKNIELFGGSEFGASGIFGSAVVDTGNGGDLNLKTNRLSIQNGATISASNFFSRGNGKPGEGEAGNINIQANSLELDNTTSEFASSITASANNSGGGEIKLDLADSLVLNNNSEITADTRGDGNGGNIAIASDKLQINRQARISVNSTGDGNAGNIDLTVNQLDGNAGKITATSQSSGGGDIKIAADFIDLQNNSEISTSVLNGTGGGGNITIDSNYILGRNNSDIRANAVEGDGGKIDITTDVMLFSFDSKVDASSQFGLDGVIEIDNLNTDKQIGVVSLPQKIVDPTALIAAVCPVKHAESLVTTGKGGLAENPSQSIRGESVWEDLRDLTDASLNSNKLEVIEAKAWNINQRGKVELLGYVPTTAKNDYWASFNQCR